MATEAAMKQPQRNCVDHGQKGMVYGYGTSRLPASVYGRRTTSAHRWAYCKDKGLHLDAIVGLDVMHTCNNARCINPAHLEVGSHSQNQKDAQENGTGYSYFRDGVRPRRYTEAPT